LCPVVRSFMALAIADHGTRPRHHENLSSKRHRCPIDVALAATMSHRCRFRPVLRRA
jgi:hypothetical protein